MIEAAAVPAPLKRRNDSEAGNKNARAQNNFAAPRSMVANNQLSGPKRRKFSHALGSITNSELDGSSDYSTGNRLPTLTTSQRGIPFMYNCAITATRRHPPTATTDALAQSVSRDLRC